MWTRVVTLHACAGVGGPMGRAETGADQTLSPSTADPQTGQGQPVSCSPSPCLSRV